MNSRVHNHDALPRSTHLSPLARELNIESLRLTPLNPPTDEAGESGPSSATTSPSVSRSASASSRRRRRFSHRTSEGGSACTSPLSSPLLGSYKHSLLSGRMSGPASPPSPFTLTLSINSLPPFRNFFIPPKLHLPFEAQFYELSGPWVGSLDLDEAPQLQTKMYQVEGGYRVPPKGQVQLVVKNQLGTVMKILVIPYDLKDMPPGTQAPMRRVWYGEGVHEPHVEQTARGTQDRDEESPPKEVIRYAVHLKFVCPSSRPPPRPRAHSAGQPVNQRSPFSKFAMTSITSANVEHNTVDSDEGDLSSHSAGEGDSHRRKVIRSSSNSSPMDKRKIFLAGEIRLVFASRVPDEEEMVRAESEEGTANENYFAWEGRPESDNQHGRET